MENLTAKKTNNFLRKFGKKGLAKNKPSIYKILKNNISNYKEIVTNLTKKTKMKSAKIGKATRKSIALIPNSDSNVFFTQMVRILTSVNVCEENQAINYCCFSFTNQRYKRCEFQNINIQT